MNRIVFIFTTLYLLLILTLQSKVRSESDFKNYKNDGLNIVVNSVGVNDKVLKLQYEIRNNSKDDAWIFAGFGNVDMNAEVFIAEDDETLIIRRRLNLRKTYNTLIPIHGRYVRLGPGKSQHESIYLKIPTHPESSFERGGRHDPGIENAKRLTIELGYYPGSLPELFISKLQTEEYLMQQYPPPVNTYDFSRWNEHLTRDEEFSIPDSYCTFKFEHILRTTIDNLSIPYQEKYVHSVKRDFPDLTSCKKMEIEYQPSMLEYFFPYDSQQNLLNQEEINYLSSKSSVVFEDEEKIKHINNDLRKVVFSDSGIIRYRSNANIVCHFDKESPLSFSIYNNDMILIDGHRFIRLENFSSFNMLTPRIYNLSLRMECAAKLKNLWYRLRLYPKAGRIYLRDSEDKKGIIVGFTAPDPMNTKTWCKDIVQTYHTPGMNDANHVNWLMKPFFCPAAGRGKCNYAMNPNCKPDSPGDMVLLFETKAGWNQHGGPELFTFDNHEPRGGCVLLNDGTVKFIRTEEELKNLRWK